MLPSTIVGSAVRRSVPLGGGAARVELADGRVVVVKEGPGVAAEAAGLRWLAVPGGPPLPAVLSLFERDPTLGLVFAEDRHCVGWGKNRPFAAWLAARMDPQPALPDWPVLIPTERL